MLKQLKRHIGKLMRRFHPPICDECGSKECTEYWYDDDNSTHLCEKHATGLFCLSCHNFTGGTEDIFLYGAWKCSFCAGTYDEYEYYDEPPEYGYDEHGYYEGY